MHCASLFISNWNSLCVCVDLQARAVRDGGRTHCSREHTLIKTVCTHTYIHLCVFHIVVYTVYYSMYMYIPLCTNKGIVIIEVVLHVHVWHVQFTEGVCYHCAVSQRADRPPSGKSKARKESHDSLAGGDVQVSEESLSPWLYSIYS